MPKPGVQWDAVHVSINRDAITCSSDGSIVIASGRSNSYLFSSLDFGATWTQLTSAGRRNWRPAAVSDDGSKIVAGTAGNYLYVSSDAGATWSVKLNSLSTKNWDDIASSSDLRYAAVIAKSTNSSTQGYLYTSSDSGATWTEQTSLADKDLQDVACSSDGSVMYVSERGSATTPSYIYKSIDYGTTWTPLPSSLQTDSTGWGTIACSDDGTTIMGIASTLWISSDGGTTWSEKTNVPSAFFGYSSLKCSSDSQVIIMTPFSSDYIVTSHNQGTTWTKQLGSGQRSWTKVAISDDGTKMYAVPSSGFVYASSGIYDVPVKIWDGSQWVKRPLRQRSGGQWVEGSVYSRWNGTQWQ